MSLTGIEIRNFQSLHAVALDLAPLTVIVGPSSSGKSAFTRALRTIANNRRGLDFLTHGTRTCTITARTEQHTVTLSRGTASGDNYYEVTPVSPDPTAALTTPQRWSKLGGEVPAEVTAALGISQGSQSFAAQHDMPYLLNDSGPSNASTLGRLTNVSVIFDAAREAKRQALDASKTLKVRASDLSSAQESLQRFENLDEQQHALSQAEEKISEAYAAQRALNSITAARDSLIAAAGAMKRLRAAADIEVPSLEPLYAVMQQLQTIEQARTALMDAATDHRAALSTIKSLEEQQQALDDERAALRANTADIFRERFEAQATGSDYEGNYVHTNTAADIAAATVEDMNA